MFKSYVLGHMFCNYIHLNVNVFCCGYRVQLVTLEKQIIALLVPHPHVCVCVSKNGDTPQPSLNDHYYYGNQPAIGIPMFIHYVTTCTGLTKTDDPFAATIGFRILLAVWTNASHKKPRTHATANPGRTQPRKKYQPQLTYCYVG